jgi:hypothetical protein
MKKIENPLALVLVGLDTGSAGLIDDDDDSTQL